MYELVFEIPCVQIFFKVWIQGVRRPKKTLFPDHGERNRESEREKQREGERQREKPRVFIAVVFSSCH